MGCDLRGCNFSSLIGYLAVFDNIIAVRFPNTSNFIV